MCMHEHKKLYQSSPSSSETSVSSDDCSDLDGGDAKETPRTFTGGCWKRRVCYAIFGTQVAAAVVFFSLYLPFALDPQAAHATYVFCNWRYDPDLSFFDNTVWTYGTDYALGCIILAIACLVPTKGRFVAAGWRSRGLLLCYVLSVLAGAIAHQTFLTVASRNTIRFRLLWSVCVGTVSAASGFMGSAATQLHVYDHNRGRNITLFGWRLPIVPDSFWLGYAVCVTLTVLAGGFSCQRPACDIFIAGITQFPSTFYVMMILSSGIQRRGVQNSFRVLGCLGFIMNAPLLPMYPMLVVHTDWALSSINTLLHSWLLVAWSLQGLTLRHMGDAIVSRPLVPVTKVE